MTEKKNEQIAVFRFGVIHEFVGGARLSADEKRRLLHDKCCRKWIIPHCSRSRISENTIYRWIRRYENSGGDIKSLYPEKRADHGKLRGIDEETAAHIVQARRQKPHLPVPLLLAELKSQCLVARTTSLATIYRLLHRQGLMEKTQAVEDRRKFEAQQPNDIWQSDVMHGPKVPVDQKSRKTYLIAFIDDHSRLVSHAAFYLSENLASFMDAFEKALLKRGLPRKLYVDNGAAYRSHKLEFTCASLSIALIHARPYKPQGKGKVERFFKTIRSQFLPTADTSNLDSLNRSLDHWLENAYHQRVHSGTGMSPFCRFTRNMSCLRQAPANLADHFRKAVYRTVAKDRTVTLDGRLFEAPVALMGRKVLLLYHEHAPEQVEVFFDQICYGLLVPVDLHVNCRVKRDKSRNIELQSGATAYQGGGLWK
ncbi:MAG: IS481 family transposase [Desulfobacterales bacterium]|jgi:transposase InsO family protein|nr:IS481 family transposase [Desulfobacterales bacterium]